MFSHAKLLPPFFHVVVARYPTGREKKPRDDKPLLQRAHTLAHTRFASRNRTAQTLTRAQLTRNGAYVTLARYYCSFAE